MNFLAHLALAGPEDASRIGNILGDFEKGTPEALKQRLPEPVVGGIIMHRKIDRFTDTHPTFKKARELLAPEHRRFAGIVIDIFFDHFLHHHWQNYYPADSDSFIVEVYQLFERRRQWLGPHFGPLVPRIQQEDWLTSYASMSGLQLTLERVASRSSRLEPILDTLNDLQKNYNAFEQHFLSFYPDARAEATRLLLQKNTLTNAFP